jgi:hypothetical protein
VEDEDPRAALVYEAAVRALDQQASVVESVRTRAGVLLSAGSVATSFLAGVALTNGRGLSPWGWVAVVSFLGVAGPSVWVLWPRHGWKFSPSATRLVADYLDPEGVTLTRAQRNLAIHMGNSEASNADALQDMFRWFEVATIALGVEVLLWIADLTFGGR